MTYVECAIDRARVLTKSGRINEKGWNKVDRISTGQLASELGSPALCNRALTERACFPRESGSEDAAIVFELIGMVGIGCDVRP